MNVELLGHATVLVRTSRTCILFDPVFSDPFEDGAVVSHPPRRIDPAALPPLDAIVLSHRHPDHLDPRSLTSLPRDLPLVCPHDPHLLMVVRAMGFRDVRPARPGSEQGFGDLTIVPTPSDFQGVPELGFLVIHPDGVVWNQVDTEVTPQAAAALAREFGPIGLHLARYASQNFEFFEDRRTQFPVEEHVRNLAVAIELGARCVVPASAGFRFAEPHAWLNAFLFPVSAERFLSDLEGLAPALPGISAAPGDVFELMHDGVEHRPAQARGVEPLPFDPDVVRFDPGGPIPVLTDPNPRGRSPDELYRYLDHWVDTLVAWLSREDAVPALRSLRRRGLAYRIEVAAPTGARWTWDLRLRSSAVDVWRTPTLTPVMTLAVAGSIFADWLSLGCSMYLLRAYRRTWSTAVELTRDGKGAHARSVPFVDLPAAWLQAKAA
jgi:L-ascorbate metabolism protein UlaG (beta-lactamase superfamily)